MYRIKENNFSSNTKTYTNTNNIFKTNRPITDLNAISNYHFNKTLESRGNKAIKAMSEIGNKTTNLITNTNPNTNKNKKSQNLRKFENLNNQSPKISAGIRRNNCKKQF